MQPKTFHRCLSWFNQCGISAGNLGVSLCLLEQMLVTPASFNSVVRGETLLVTFTICSKNPGDLYGNVNGKTILARPTGKLLK